MAPVSECLIHLWEGRKNSPKVCSVREKQSAFNLARLLAILGGLLTVVSGARDTLSLVGRRNIPSLEVVTSAAILSVVVIALGLAAILGSRSVRSVAWNVVLIIVGLLGFQFTGGFPWFLGPVLVIFAGFVGIIAKLA